MARTAQVARAMLRASGLQDDDFKKPLVGVAILGSRLVPATITSVTSRSM